MFLKKNLKSTYIDHHSNITAIIHIDRNPLPTAWLLKRTAKFNIL
jgi:hypothetical protein